MKIVMLGAGNLATNLGLALKKQGHEILQVYSRTYDAAEQLARQTVSEATTRLNRIVRGADLYILSVSDDAMEEVLWHFPFRDAFLVHTAGSVPMDILKGYVDHCGVVYPLQTFSKERTVDFQGIPLCLEASSPEKQNLLEKMAYSLSGNVHHVNSYQRQYLHVAAVFACNFTNYMFTQAESILYDKNMAFDLLAPLIRETVDKALAGSPARSQTGPARRGDQQTLQRHLNLLAHSDKLQKLYSFVSDAIEAEYKSH